MTRSILAAALLLTAMSASLLIAADDDDKPRVQSVELTGIVVTLHDLFDAVPDTAEKPAGHALGDRVLVAKTGVYAFLEIPANEEALKDIKPGDAVTLKARMLRDSNLLQVESLHATDAPADLDLDAVRAAEGTPVTLTGTNACQCQLHLDSMPTTCKLGHLHHLQTEDQHVYTYIPIGEAANNIAGKGTHGKKVTVEADRFADHFLFVKSTTVE